MSAIVDIEKIRVGGTGARYRVWCDEKVIIESSKEPLTESARLLSSRGVTGRLRLRRKGMEGWDIEGLISVLANLTISEGNEKGPRFVKWVPYLPNQTEFGEAA